MRYISSFLSHSLTANILKKEYNNLYLPYICSTITQNTLNNHYTMQLSTNGGSDAVGLIIALHKCNIYSFISFVKISYFPNFYLIFVDWRMSEF